MAAARTAAVHPRPDPIITAGIVRKGEFYSLFFQQIFSFIMTNIRRPVHFSAIEHSARNGVIFQ